MLKYKQVLGILVVLMLVVSCASFSKNAYRALGTSSVAYDVSIRTVADLYRQKLVGEDVKAKTIELGNIFWVAYNSALDAMVAYKKTEKAEDKAKLEAALTQANEAFVKFLGYVQPYLPKEVK